VNRNFSGTKRQAQSALAKLVTEVEQQEVTAAGAGKLSELLDRWLDYISPHRAAYTVYEYSRLIEKTIKPALGNVRVDRLAGFQLDAFYRKLEERGLSGSSIHQHHSILHASLGRAVKWGLIATNPADRATAPRPARSNVSAPAVAKVADDPSCMVPGPAKAAMKKALAAARAGLAAAKAANITEALGGGRPSTRLIEEAEAHLAALKAEPAKVPAKVPCARPVLTRCAWTTSANDSTTQCGWPPGTPSTPSPVPSGATTLEQRTKPTASCPRRSPPQPTSKSSMVISMCA